MSVTAKLFINGGSQAVRLPKEFRFDGEEVRVRRVGHAVLLEPLAPGTWPKGYWSRLPRIDDGDWSRPEDGVPPPVERERDVP
jgi:antitoxin VapB